jgi:RNA polymerase sigma-70 factor (ECF subfamily)
MAHVRREVDNQDVFLQYRDERPGPDEMAERCERVELLDEILAELRPEQREVFVMFELEDLSGKQIAAIVEAPVKTVFSRLRLAREAFAAALASRRQRSAEPTVSSPMAVPAVAGKGQAP